LIFEACRVIWVLALDEKCKTELMQEGIIDILREFSINDHPGARKAMDGALWILQGSKPENTPQYKEKAENIAGAGSDQQSGHVMISYCWAQKNKVRSMAEAIKKQGFVEEVLVVVMCLSSHYKESQACRTEAEYAYRLKKPVIHVMVEDGFAPKGFIGQ